MERYTIMKRTIFGFALFISSQALGSTISSDEIERSSSAFSADLKYTKLMFGAYLPDGVVEEAFEDLPANEDPTVTELKGTYRLAKEVVAETNTENVERIQGALEGATGVVRSQEDREIKRVGLSIDGGGLRGEIPVTWLSMLEMELQEARPKSNLCEYFDCIGGSSIGGIVAIGVSACRYEERPNIREPLYSAQQLLPLFELHGADIFPPSNFLARKMHLVYDLARNHYSPVPLENLLKRYFGLKRNIQDHTLTDVLVTSAPHDHSAPVFFTSTPGIIGPVVHNWELWKIGRATSAGPSYFPSFYNEVTQKYLVDGGIVVNNPAMLVQQALMKKHQLSSEANTYVVSLGTGDLPCEEEFEHKGGLVNAGKAGIEGLMTHASQLVDMLMTSRLGDHYNRVQVKLDRVIHLDNADPETLQYMKGVAMSSQQKEHISAIARKLITIKDEVK